MMRVKKEIKKIFFLSFVGIDFSIFLISLFLAYQVRIFLQKTFPEIFPTLNFPLSYFIIHTFWIPGFLIFFIALEGLYTQNFFYSEEIKKTVKSIFLWLFTVFFIIGIAKKSGEVSRLIIILTGIFLIFFLPITKLILKSFLFKKHIGIKKLFLVGVNENSLKVVNFFQQNTTLGYKVTGFFDSNPKAQINEEIKNINLKIKPLKCLKKALKLKLADGVLIYLNKFSHEKDFLKFIGDLQKLTSEIYIIPDKKNLAFLKFNSLPLFGSELTLFKYQNHTYSTLNKILKNIIDFSITLLFLPLVLALGIFITIFIKIDSPGPVFFTQERIGKDGKKIKIYKFRTMFNNAEYELKPLLEKNQKLAEEWNKKRKLPLDPRITRVGRFLRRFSLDELPQFINILKGEMSLIGPRPVTEEELNLYYKDFRNIYIQVKPGLTGLWQVMGRNEIDYPTRVLMDVYYVLNWSPWLDFYILLKTPIVLITGRGAY